MAVVGVPRELFASIPDAFESSELDRKRLKVADAAAGRKMAIPLAGE